MLPVAMIEFTRHELFYTALRFASVLLLALSFLVFLRGRRVARAALLSKVGVGVLFGALAARGWLEFRQAAGWTPVVNNVLWAATVGMAHVVMLRYVPLPRSYRVWRAPLGWFGAGSLLLAGFVLTREEVDGPLEIFFLLTLSATVLTWGLALNFLIRPRRVLREGEFVPCVRFGCPRCAVLVDWGRGGMPCPECGLFVHADWTPSGENAGHESDPTLVANPAVLPPGRAAVALRCPQCKRRGLWPYGRSACESCGLWLRLSWNVHGAGAAT